MIFELHPAPTGSNPPHRTDRQLYRSFQYVEKGSAVQHSGPIVVDVDYASRVDLTQAEAKALRFIHYNTTIPVLEILHASLP